MSCFYLNTLICICSGEANGTAYVQFEDTATAKDAFQRYNNVALDGKPMKIAFDQGSSRTLSSGIRCALMVLGLFMCHVTFAEWT